MNICEICGNEFPAERRICPFCKAEQTGNAPRKKVFRLREANLEEGKPTVDAAITKMEQAVREAKRSGCSVLILIHGYGSSGRGGAIRTECRKVLAYLLDKGDIGGFTAGEAMHSHRREVRQWLRRFPKLAKNRYLNSGNKGITFVFLP